MYDAETLARPVRKMALNSHYQAFTRPVTGSASKQREPKALPMLRQHACTLLSLLSNVAATMRHVKANGSSMQDTVNPTRPPPHVSSKVQLQCSAPDPVGQTSSLDSPALHLSQPRALVQAQWAPTRTCHMCRTQEL